MDDYCNEQQKLKNLFDYDRFVTVSLELTWLANLLQFYLKVQSLVNTSLVSNDQRFLDPVPVSKLESVYKVIPLERKGRWVSLKKKCCSAKRVFLNLPSGLSPVHLHHISGWLCIGRMNNEFYEIIECWLWTNTKHSNKKVPPASIGCYESHMITGVTLGPSHGGCRGTPNSHYGYSILMCILGTDVCSN